MRGMGKGAKCAPAMKGGKMVAKAPAKLPAKLPAKAPSKMAAKAPPKMSRGARMERDDGLV